MTEAAKKEIPYVPEGDVDIGDEKVVQRKHGSSFEKDAKFTGLPTEDDILEALRRKLIPNPNDKAEKAGKGWFKQLVMIPSLKGWRMRIRHRIEKNYYACLAQRFNYCPMCASKVLAKRDRKATIPDDTYLTKLAWVRTDYDGFTLLFDDGNTTRTPEFVVAYAVMGGAKMRMIKDICAPYGNNPAGIFIQTVCDNPDFWGWKASPLGDRTETAKALTKAFVVDPSADAFEWKPEVLDRCDKEGLPKKLWDQWLCKELSIEDAIREFRLDDQVFMIEQLKQQGNDKGTHAGNSAPGGGAQSVGVGARGAGRGSHHDSEGKVDPESFVRHMPVTGARKPAELPEPPPQDTGNLGAEVEELATL